MVRVSAAVIIAILYKNTKISTTGHIEQRGAEIYSAPRFCANTCVDHFLLPARSSLRCLSFSRSDFFKIILTRRDDGIRMTDS